MAASLIDQTAYQGLTIWQRMADAYRAKRHANAHVPYTAMAAPPTIARTDAAPVGLTRIFSTLPVSNAFTYTGYALPIQDFGGGARFPAMRIDPTTGGNLGNGYAAQSWRVKCVVDAIAPAFQVVGTGFSYRFIIIEQGQPPRYVSLTGTAATTGGFANYIQLTFATRAIREIWIEGQQGGSLRQVLVALTESVWNSASDGLTWYIRGDSILGATAVPQIAFGDGFGVVLADCFGAGNVIAAGQGGQGMIQSANTGALYTLQQEMGLDWPTLGGVRPDVVVYAYGANDTSYSRTQCRDACLQILDMTRNRQAFAKGPIIVLGTPGNATGPSAASLNVERGYQDAVFAFGDPDVLFVPLSTVTPDPFLFGTGNAGAPNTTGNSDLYVSSDNVHPNGTNNVGHLHYGLYIADAIYFAITSRP